MALSTTYVDDFLTFDKRESDVLIELPSALRVRPTNAWLDVS